MINDLNPYNEAIRLLLEEVDDSIKQVMLKPNEIGEPTWWFFQNPALTILEWQALRDRKR